MPAFASHSTRQSNQVRQNTLSRSRSHKALKWQDRDFFLSDKHRFTV